MNDQHIGYIIKFMPYQYYMSQIIIIISGLVYALVLLSIVLFRPWVVTEPAKNLLLATSISFISGVCTRLAFIFIHSKSENMLMFFMISQTILTISCSYCAILSWFKLEKIFSVRSPEDIANRVFSSIKEDIWCLDEITPEQVCEIIDNHESVIRRWVYSK